MPSLLQLQHRVAVPAAALIVLAAVAACTSKNSRHTTATAAGAAAATVRVTGAGSTFDAPFDLAFPHYQQAHPEVAVSYASVGSSSGITRFTGGKADFGATDVPASAHDLAAASGGATVQVPVDLGALVVAYNAPVLNSGPLKLTGPVIARIFLAQIKRWDDPAITALNPGADLPRTYINGGRDCEAAGKIAGQPVRRLFTISFRDLSGSELVRRGSVIKARGPEATASERIAQALGGGSNVRG